MPTELFANDPPAITLNGAITAAATTLVVSSSTGWPAASAGTGTQFRVRIDNEYLIVTNVAGTTWTVTRGAEGSTAATHATGAPVNHVLTRDALAYLLNLVRFTPPAADDPDGVLYFDTAAPDEPLGYREVGEYIWWSAAALPLGYVECNGQAISRTDYPELFALWGTFYGAGDGATTFNVPDARKRMLVHRDATNTRFDTLGETGGAESVTLTALQSGLRAHEHHRAFYNSGGAGTAAYLGAAGATNWQIAPDGNAGVYGGAQPAQDSHENMPPYLVGRLLVRAVPYSALGSGTIATLPDYSVAVGRSSNFTTASGWNTIPWQVTEYDTATYWAVGQPTRLTVPPGLGGKYDVDAWASFDLPSSFDQLVSLYRNGVEWMWTRHRQSDPFAGLHAHAQGVLLNPGDYVEARVYHQSGALILLAANTRMTLRKVA